MRTGERRGGGGRRRRSKGEKNTFVRSQGGGIFSAFRAEFCRMLKTFSPQGGVGNIFFGIRSGRRIISRSSLSIGLISRCVERSSESVMIRLSATDRRDATRRDDPADTARIRTRTRLPSIHASPHPPHPLPPGFTCRQVPAALSRDSRVRVSRAMSERPRVLRDTSDRDTSPRLPRSRACYELPRGTAGDTAHLYGHLNRAARLRLSNLYLVRIHLDL